MATASCGNRGRVTEEEELEEVGNNEEMGRTEVMTEGVGCGETIAVDGGKVKVRRSW